MNYLRVQICRVDDATDQITELAPVDLPVQRDKRAEGLG